MKVEKVLSVKFNHQDIKEIVSKNVNININNFVLRSLVPTYEGSDRGLQLEVTIELQDNVTEK